MATYLLVAALIALGGLGIAQLSPGAGAPFVAAVSGLWVVYVIERQRRMKRDG